jgi:tRNA-specific adenosine deaminase 1
MRFKRNSSKRRSTGMKCLPASKLAAANGVAIHDWHAEILAMRALNRYLLDECQRLYSQSACSSIVERNQHEADSKLGTNPVPPFRIRKGVKLHMYCSEAPCKSPGGTDRQKLTH